MALRLLSFHPHPCLPTSLTPTQHCGKRGARILPSVSYLFVDIYFSLRTLRTTMDVRLQRILLLATSHFEQNRKILPRRSRREQLVVFKVVNVWREQSMSRYRHVVPPNVDPQSWELEHIALTVACAILNPSMFYIYLHIQKLADMVNFHRRTCKVGR